MGKAVIIITAFYVFVCKKMCIYSEKQLIVFV